MSEKQVQVNIRLAESSADRLKGLAESTGLKIGAFVERMIAAYSADSSLLQNDSSAVQWQSVVEELRGIVASQEKRLNALEVAVMTPITAGGGKVRITLQPADLAPMEPVETEPDSPSHPAESSTPPPLSQDELEALVKETYKECGDKIGKTMAALREKGQGVGQKRLYKILGRKAWVG